jgi:hypothetical protein
MRAQNNIPTLSNIYINSSCTSYIHMLQEALHFSLRLKEPQGPPAPLTNTKNSLTGFLVQPRTRALVLGFMVVGWPAPKE